MTAVFDASAVLAILFEEPGAQEAASYLSGATISAVNWLEVVTRLISREITEPLRTAEEFLDAGMKVVSLDQAVAQDAAAIFPITRSFGLSAGDRACLALTRRTPEGFAVTTDRAWASPQLAAGLGIEVRMVRPRADSA